MLVAGRADSHQWVIGGATIIAMWTCGPGHLPQAHLCQLRNPCGQKFFILRSYCGVGCGSQVPSRRCAHLPRTERPRVSQRACPGRAWNEGTWRQHPGLGHSPPSLATDSTGAEHWTGRLSASPVPEHLRSPFMCAPSRQGRALFAGEGNCFYGLHNNESIHHTACQAPILTRRSVPRPSPCSTAPMSPTSPRTASEWNAQAMHGCLEFSRS